MVGSGNLTYMGENPANPNQPGVSSVPGSIPAPMSNDNFAVPNPVDSGQVGQAVNPAMPNAMGVTMDVPQNVPLQSNQQIGQDPNVAPNPFVTPSAPVEQPAGVGTASVMPDASAPQPSLNLPHPEVVTGGGGKGGNAPWVVLGALASVVVIGIIGAFAYFSFVAVTPVEVASSPAPVVEASVSAIPAPKAMTLDEKIAMEEASLNDLAGSLSAADKSLSDKQGDLSE